MMRRRVHDKPERAPNEERSRATTRRARSQVAAATALTGNRAASVAQRASLEDDEPLQGRFEVAQRTAVEDDEPLQGRFDVAQRATLDDEELQMKQPPAKNATGMPDRLKAGIESLSGIALDDVRVHYNSAQPAQLGALAYAQGTDIHVAPGQERHLPHEAWHIVQQAQGRVKPTMQLENGATVNDDPQLEHEADTFGASALGTMAMSQDRHRDDTATTDGRTADRHPIQPVWNFANPNLASTQRITPLDNRGIALRFTDGTGDRMVVKMTENPPELERMASAVYGEIGEFDVLRTVDLTPQIPALQVLICNGVISTGDAWTDVAQQNLPHLNLHGLGWKPPTLAWVANNLGQAPRPYVQGMPFATGTETARLATGQGVEGQRFRQLFTNFPYMVQLGRLAAFDIFLANGDRVLGGNLGNWFTDVPSTSVASLIDNADQHTRSTWVQGHPTPPAIGGNITADLGSLAQDQLDVTANQIAFNLADAARQGGAFANPAARNTWLNAAHAAAGMTNRQFMTEALATGMRAGKEAIVRGLVTRKTDAPGRAVKAVSEGIHSGAGVDWWETIKQRARQLEAI